MDEFFFYAFSLLAIGGAVQTVLRRNAVHCAIWLIVALLGVAGLFLLAGAEFLFAVQIILYIGGIVLLFLFVIMLVNLDLAERERQFNRQWWAALAVVAVAAFSVVFRMRWPVTSAVPMPAGGNTQQLGEVLFHEYLLPFEISSVLLLVAIVGSVVMGKRRA